MRRDVQISGITEHATVSPEVDSETGCVTGVTELATVSPEVEIETGGVTELATKSSS